MPARKLRDSLQLCLREHFAGRIPRRIDDDGLRLRRNRLFQLSRGKAPSWRVHLHDDRDRLNREQGADVVLIVRLEQHDFIAGVQDCFAGAMESSGRPGADNDFFLGIGFDPVVARQLSGNGLPQFRQSVKAGIDIVPVLDRPLSGL